MRAAPIGLLLLVALAACASARPFGEWPEDILSAVKVWNRLDADGYADWARRVAAAADEDEKFVLLAHFDVRPSLASDFKEIWVKMKEEAEQQEGLVRFGISKTLSDNRLFLAYEEWESKDAFLEHLKKKGSQCKKMSQFVEENDIGVKMTQLDSLAATTDRSSNSQGSAEEEEDKAIVLLRFMVRPSMLDEFAGIAQDLTKAVSASEGDKNIVLAFKKDALDDYTVYGYGVWKNQQALEEHLESDSFKEFKSFTMGHDIFAQKSCMKPIVKVSSE